MLSAHGRTTCFEPNKLDGNWSDDNLDIRYIKQTLGKKVHYDTLQLNFDGCSMKDFIFTACILRKKKNGPLYYLAELTDATAKNSVLIVPLEKVLLKDKD